MGRFLAIDYGKKRIGLAATDPLQLSTKVLPYQQETKIREWLLSYFTEEQVEKVVIGCPTHEDGTKTDLNKDIDLLVAFIEEKTEKIQIVKVDESFSSKDAMNLMIKRGIKKKKRSEKGLIDSYSALIILEEYLSSRK